VDTWVQVVLTSVSGIVASIIASGGFWAYLHRKGEAKSSTTTIVMGLAYDKITSTGVEIVNRGVVTKDELEELNNFYWGPYKALGGNGVAEQIMNRVHELPIIHSSRFADILPPNEGFVNNVRVIPPRQSENTTSR
jgi:hypothetical protein